MNFRNFQWRSLKTKVTLFTLAIFLIGIWALTFYVSRMLREDTQRLLGEQQFSTVSLIAAGIDGELNMRLRALEGVAQQISPALLDDTAALQAFLEQHTVFQTLFNDGSFATRSNGIVTASIPLSAGRRGVSVMDRDYMIAALKDGKATIGRPVIDKILPHQVLLMAAPIRDAQGSVIGALTGVTDLGAPNFLDKINKGKYGSSGNYLLAAPQHHLFVTSSDKSRIMRPLPAPGVNPLHDRFAQGYEGYGVLVNFRGEEELAAAKGIPAAGWFLGIGLPTAEAFAPIRKMQQRMLVAAIFLTLLAGGLTSWMLRRQLSPMLAAMEALTALSTDDPPIKPLPIAREDEIGQLIGGFNRLTETLWRRNEALKASEVFTQTILNSVAVGIAVLNHKGTILAVNEPWRRFARENGSAAQGADVGANYFAVCIGGHGYSADQAADICAGIRAVLDRRVPSFSLEYPWPSQEQARWFSMNVTPLGDAPPGGAVITHTNITERKRSENSSRALQTQIKLAAQVFAQAREGITVTDADCNIIMVNQAFTVITGYTEAEVLGKNPRLLASGRHGPEFYAAMWDAINTKGDWAGEIWDRRKDGSVYPEWMAISVMRDEHGQITHYLGNFTDLSDTKAAENRIQWLSHFDSLTGLPNRALLKDRTAHSLSMAQRASEPLTMMLVGIDNFKTVNDTLGHDTGDALLVEMGRRLSDSVREQDTVARLSGKEFVLVLPHTPAAGAVHLATELLWKLAQPYQLGGHELTLTASIGIASFPDNGRDFDALFKAVEIAMHRAQSNGRDTFQFYSEDMYRQVLARDFMVKALRQAAALDQLQLVFQPLVDLQTGQISGLEALLRWHHPELGAVAPAQFIPLAEESGLIKSIGEWVLRQACRDIRTWLDKGIKIAHVAVNVSPLQFHDPDLIAQVKNALADYRVNADLLYLEVTESALMDDVHRSEAMLKELKALGVKLSLDDFGTGYSSLSYLKRFPFDKVKIDQSFVRDITISQSDNLIVKVIISMANGLGLKVIAEGVETEAQCEIMRTNGCDEIQGYFFSRPISAGAIEELLSEGRQLPPHLLRLQKPQRTLLLVDDEPNIVASLKRLFRRDGHVILTANSGPEGLDVLARHKVDVIISDQRMPGMTGVEFLRAAKVNYPDTIRIVLSGYTELQSVTDAINEGAVYRFLTKPWDDEQLREQIQKAFAHKELQEENRQLDIRIRSANQQLVAANRRLGEVLQGTRDQIERDEASLAIMREALQHIPLPVIAVDDKGLMAFVNAAAQRLFAHAGPLLGVELAKVLPAIDAAMRGAEEDVPCELQMDGASYLLKWNAMGANPRSRGRLLTLNLRPPTHD